MGDLLMLLVLELIPKMVTHVGGDAAVLHLLWEIILLPSLPQVQAIVVILLYQAVILLEVILSMLLVIPIITMIKPMSVSFQELIPREEVF